MDRSVLARKPMTELKDIASHLNMRGYNKLRKAELIDAIIASGTGGDQQTLDTADGQDGPAGDRSGGDDRPSTSRPDDRGGDADDDGDAGDAADDGDDAGDDADRADGGADRADGGDGAGRSRQRDRADDDGQGDGSKRRSRRDRRKRNRDRGDDDQQGGQQTQSKAEGQAKPDGRSTHENQSRSRSQSKSQNPSQSQSASGGGGGGHGDPGEVRAGVLDILPEGYGFLRTTGYLPGERDVYVSQGQIRKHGLRRGDVVQGPIRQQRSNEKVPALHHVQKVNGEPLEDGQVPARPAFDELPITADPARVALSDVDSVTTAVRMVDLLAPIGLGQRALVMAPPRAAKERLLRELADVLVDALPDAHLMMVLLDERPEVVTLAVDEVDGEVIASTFDQTAEEHAQIAELALERARRMVELGHDVVVLVDSLTRLGRAHGVIATTSGKVIAPGVEAASLYPLKRMLSAARRIDGGGSLTLVGVALTDTGSAQDEVILQEVRRTASSDIVMDDSLTRRRVWPSISAVDSDTRDEAELHDEDERAAVTRLRRTLEGLDPADASALVVDKLVQTDDNAAFLTQIRTAPLGGASDDASQERR